MGKDLIATLQEIASTFLEISAEEAAKKVEQLEKDKRIIKEIWG